jgi:hypothetical protein
LRERQSAPDHRWEAGRVSRPLEIIATAKWANVLQIYKALINTCGKGLFDDRVDMCASGESCAYIRSFISVVICTCNCADQLPVCLDALSLKNNIEFDASCGQQCASEFGSQRLGAERKAQDLMQI